MPFDKLRDSAVRTQVRIQDAVSRIQDRLISNKVEINSKDRLALFLKNNINEITTRDAYFGFSAYVKNDVREAANVFSRLRLVPTTRAALEPLLPSFVRKLIESENYDALNAVFKSANNQPRLQRTMRVSVILHLANKSFVSEERLEGLALLDGDLAPVNQFKIDVFKGCVLKAVFDIHLGYCEPLWKKSQIFPEYRDIIKEKFILSFRSSIACPNTYWLDQSCKVMQKESELACEVGADLGIDALKMLLRQHESFKAYNVFRAFRHLPAFIASLTVNEISPLASHLVSAQDCDYSAELEKFWQSCKAVPMGCAAAISGLRRGFPNLACGVREQGKVLKYLQVNRNNPAIFSALLEGVTNGYDRMNGYVALPPDQTISGLALYKEGGIDPHVTREYLRCAALGTARVRHFKRQEALQILKNTAANIPDGLESVQLGIAQARKDWAIRLAPELPGTKESQDVQPKTEARQSPLLKLIKS